MTLISKDKPRYGTFIKSRPNYFDETPVKFLNEIAIDEGNLLFYYVKNPFSLGAVLLDKTNSHKILWRSATPIWRTCEKISPLEITHQQHILRFHFKLKGVLFSVDIALESILAINQASSPLKRTLLNPIIKPNRQHAWESIAVFNPGVLYLDGRVHFLYRAVGETGVSVLGYASSRDGLHIDERLDYPIYVLRNDSGQTIEHPSLYQHYLSGSNWCGCEDPRLTQIDDTIYMIYTAFDGYHAPRLALTSINMHDFLHKNWHWKKQTFISHPSEMHKNWVLFPEKMMNQFAILHSITPNILIDYFNDLNFDSNDYIKSQYQSCGRDNHWDNWMRGVGPPPIKTKDGWLVLYHAMDRNDPNRYKIGALLLDVNNPYKVLSRSPHPLLAPDAHYENEGCKTGVVYTCGAVVIDDKLFIYYGGADTVVCAAYASLNDVLTQVKNDKVLTLVTT